MLTSAGTLVSPYVLKIIIDDVFPSKDYNLLLNVLFVYAFICLVRILVMYCSAYLFEWISNNLMKDIRTSLYSHMIRLPLSFFDSKKTGDIIHRLNNEVNSIQSVLTSSVVRFINSVCTICGLTIMLSVLNLKLFLISLIILPFIYFNTIYFQPKIRDNIMKGRKLDSIILSVMIEVFRNIKLVKNFMSYSIEEKKLKSHIDKQINLNMINIQLVSLTKNISTFFTVLIPILILGIGGKEVMLNTMSIGALVAFIQYMNRLFDPFRELMSLYFDLVKASVSMERIFEIICIKQESNVPTIATFPKLDNFEIRFHNISFGYDDVMVLRNINLVLQAGKSYALVGGSGSGKSTIVNLLCRFYEPNIGTIYINDINIKHLSLAELRSHINLITQDNHLFHDTIYNNICYGKDFVNLSEVQVALSKSSLYNEISSLPYNTNTVIGDQGTTLSGGQRQRIAIARAFLKKVEIIIFDEATSGVDSEKELDILNSVNEYYCKNEIKIFISHRLSTIKNVDSIICLNDGQVIESGSHDFLINQKGFYWNLYKNQI